MSGPRALFQGLVAVTIALLATIALLVYVWGQANSANSALKANVQSQARNRVLNVDVWCRSINAGRDYDRAFIRHVTRGHLIYALSDLDCAALEANTRASTRPH